MKEKFRCCQCNQLALWVYIPATRNEYPYYCDRHVPRGCTCNEPEEVDAQGRPLPCCEFEFSQTGWEIEDAESMPPLQERLNQHDKNSS